MTFPSEKSLDRGSPTPAANEVIRALHAGSFLCIAWRKLVPTRSGLFGVSRSAFYKAEIRINERCLQEALVLNEVRQIKKDQPKLGTEKVYLKISPFLDGHGTKMGRVIPTGNKLYDLLRAYHLLPKRGRSAVRTTYSKHHFYKYPNLVKDLEVLRPNLIWCSDITYIRTGNRWSYLSLITDAYSHKLIGWSLQPSLRVDATRLKDR